MEKDKWPSSGEGTTRGRERQAGIGSMSYGDLEAKVGLGREEKGPISQALLQLSRYCLHLHFRLSAELTVP